MLMPSLTVYRLFASWDVWRKSTTYSRSSSSAKGRLVLRIRSSSSRSGKSIKILGWSLECMYSGSSKVLASSFMVMHKRREGGPALFTHPVPLINYCHTALDHRGDNGACHIPYLTGLGDDRGNDKILWPGVHGCLEKIYRFL